MPAPIPDEQIAAVRALVEHQLSYDPYPYLKEGMRVRIKRGPLTGAEGILVEKRRHYRFIISVDLIQKSVAVDIDAADIEAVH
jgi:transcription antitermination factor NusG